jgi:predicted RNA-binding protein
LKPDRLGPQYVWATRWEQAAQLRTTDVQQSLRAALDGVERIPSHELDVESEPSMTFCDYVLHEYQPPRDKRFLVFFQCSVRRPFSTAPSHAAMRKAIRVATGYDPSPSKDFESCPVHVVVLASKVGPVPYELEDLYPANVRGSGVKQFDWRRYERVKPILAERMAQYVLEFREHYEQITTFTQGRYAEVMEAAQRIAVERAGKSLRFPILPKAGGTSIVRSGASTPHQYWARYWIQLYLEIVSWLKPDQQQQAAARLAKLKVEYR